MKEQLLAERYAKAFMSLVESADHKSLLNDIDELRFILEKAPDFIKTIHSVVLPRKMRIELVGLLDEHVSHQELWSSLFSVLVHKHRFNILPDVLDAVEMQIHAENDEVKVRLTLARPHREAVMDNIRRLLEDILQHRVILKTSVDPAIGGGFVARTRSMLVNASLQDNLERFASRKTY